jgi:hypothetical protein
MPDDDPRRQKPVTLSWRSDEVCRMYIDEELWGAVEWSEKRQAWCIEDEGRCLSHKSHVHGSAVAKNEAVALAQAMIADGRMPTPEQAKQARFAARAVRVLVLQEIGDIKRHGSEWAPCVPRWQHVATCRSLKMH